MLLDKIVNNLNPVKIRLLLGVTATAFDKFAVLLIQLVSIRVLSQEWGVELLGVWLMLMTFPMYLRICDFGITNAAQVEINKAIGSADFKKALEVTQSSWLLGSITTTVLCVVVLLTIYLLSSLNAISSLNVYFPSILCIAFYSLMMIQTAFLYAILRANSMYPISLLFSGVTILIQGTAVFVVSTHGLGIFEASLASFIVQTLSFIITLTFITLKLNWFSLTTPHFSLSRIKELLSPSFTSLTLSLANAVLLQGVTLILGLFVGPAVVAILNSTRTVSRVPLQLTGMLVSPSIPELTSAYVRGNLHLAERIMKSNILLALSSTLPFLVIIIFFGEDIIFLLSAGTIEVTSTLFFLLGLIAVVNAVNLALTAPLISMNKQGLFSKLYLLLSLTVLLIPIFFESKILVLVALNILIVEFILLFRLIFLLKRGL